MNEQEGWAAYAAEQERHAETRARLDLMTREARLSREAAERAVRTRVSTHEIERALRAAGPPEDSMTKSDPLVVVHYEGRAEAVEIVRIMLGWTDDLAASRLHACIGCGLELDADDRNDRCEDCEVHAPTPTCVCGHHKVVHAPTDPSWCLERGGCDCHEYEAG